MYIFWQGKQEQHHRWDYHTTIQLFYTQVTMIHEEKWGNHTKSCLINKLYISLNGMEPSKLRNRMENSLVYLNHCLEHPAICVTYIAVQAMSVSEISTRIAFRVSAELLNTAENHCYFVGWNESTISKNWRMEKYIKVVWGMVIKFCCNLWSYRYMASSVV